MTKQEIAYLLKAGYTMQEIMSLDGIQPTQDPEQKPEKKSEPEQKPTQEHEQKPAQAPEQKPTGDNAILAAIENLTNTIRAGNIRAGGFPAPEGANSTENILASIINPPGYTGGNEKGGNK